MKMRITLLLLLCCLAMASQAWGNSMELRLQALEETLRRQEKTIKEQQKIIGVLKKQVEALQTLSLPSSEQPSDDRIVKPVVAAKSSNAGFLGESHLTHPNISLILNTYAYSSSLATEEVHSRILNRYTRQGLERHNGFNLEAAELHMFAPVDPYFNLYAAIPVKEDGVELEEAYFVTTALPRGHQIKGGKFKSGFGRHNAQHPHAWDFADGPLPYRAFTGGEGITEKGAQYTYLPPLPFYALFGLEVLQGDNSVLFGTDAASGAHAYSAFVKTSFDLSDHATLLAGGSVITGKANTDTVRDNTNFTGDSTLYGLDFTYKWRPSRDHQFKVQGEYLYRTQFGRLNATTLAMEERLDRNQDGLYLQGVYQWNRWGMGVRYDVLGLFKDEYRLAGNLRDIGRRPWRLSGKVDYGFSEFGLLRFQYTHDEADITSKVNHECFLQFIFGIGAHAAHPF